MVTGCTNGDIRLVNGSSTTEGTVEVCSYNTWGLVADGGWGPQEAQVTCRQLNLQGMILWGKTKSFPPQNVAILSTHYTSNYLIMKPVLCRTA